MKKKKPKKKKSLPIQNGCLGKLCLLIGCISNHFFTDMLEMLHRRNVPYMSQDIFSPGHSFLHSYENSYFYIF